jgi:maltose alpha-D-glucosyltransferase/alpha-amylase
MPASGASLLLNAEGVFTALLAWFIFRENFDRRIALGMVLIVAGAAVLSWPGEARFSGLWPALSITGACLAWGIDNNLTRKISLADATWIASIKGLVAGTVNLALAFSLGSRLPAWASGLEAMVLGLLSGLVREGTEAWRYTLDHLGLFYESALTHGPSGPPADKGEALAAEMSGSYLEFVRLLGRRTAELHLALAANAEDPAFAPEPYTDFYRHGLYHGMLARLGRTSELLRSRLKSLPEDVRPDVQGLLERQAAVRTRFQYLRDNRITAMRIRVHGDLHLGQVLYTGRDFVFLDFEGDPDRPLSERRIKRSPLQDIAGMLDSLYHASHGVLFGEAPGVIPKPESLKALNSWAKLWFRTAGAAYVTAYLATPGIDAYAPSNREHLRALLRLFLLDTSLRKVAHLAVDAPARVRIPIHAILELLEATP